MSVAFPLQREGWLRVPALRRRVLTPPHLHLPKARGSADCESRPDPVPTPLLALFFLPHSSHSWPTLTLQLRSCVDSVRQSMQSQPACDRGGRRDHHHP